MSIGSRTLNHLRSVWAEGFTARWPVWNVFGRLLIIIALQAGLPAGATVVAAGTPLGRAVSAASAAHPGTSGVLLLDTGSAALDERDALIDAAVHTIDAQYYIWNADASGRYLAARLLAAAERGVQVRILLDDINVAGRDVGLSALAAHPRVEVRVYNPTAARSGVRRLFGFVSEFSRLNRRMHNKSFTVDRAVTIVGGRNIGNEYFDLDPEKNFRDRDILAAGPVVAEVAAGFEAFWTSRWTQLAITLAGNASFSPKQLEAANGRLDSAADELRALGHPLPAVRPDPGSYTTGLLARLLWMPVQLVFDLPPDPDGMADSSRPQAVAMALRALATSARREILIESAYLILDEQTFAETRSLTSRGVRIRALTNSLASNDLVTNHSGYARRRRGMLDSGMEVFELRPDAGACQRLIATGGGCTDTREFALHSKSLVVDRRTVYVGSFNINLRSTYLNSETALIIDSPVLAERIAGSIEELMAPDSSWQVLRRASGGLEWRTETADGPVVVTQEPMSGFWRRFQSRFYRMFPLEKYL
jgi:putative cardiolipin synthase